MLDLFGHSSRQFIQPILRDWPVNSGANKQVQRSSASGRLNLCPHGQVQSEVEKLERTSSSKVLVVGSGPAGVELATTLADRLKGTATVELISTGMTASAAYFGTYTILLIVLLCQSRSMNLILSCFVSFPRPNHGTRALNGGHSLK